MTKISEIFGRKVFNDSVMKERLSASTYRQLHETIKRGTDLNSEIAERFSSETKMPMLTTCIEHYTGSCSQRN